MSSRRDFLKLSCGLCAALGGAGIVATLLESCSSIPLVKASVVNGNVSIGENEFGKSKYILLRPKNLMKDILVVKVILADDHVSYNALLMECTHQQQPLSVNGEIIHCATHGSEFDLEGNVKKEPALLPLKKYTTTAKDGKITIDLNS